MSTFWEAPGLSEVRASWFREGLRSRPPGICGDRHDGTPDGWQCTREPHVDEQGRTVGRHIAGVGSGRILAAWPGIHAPVESDLTDSTQATDWRADLAEALGASPLLQTAHALGWREGRRSTADRIDDARRALYAQIEQNRTEQARIANDAVRLAEHVAELEREVTAERARGDRLQRAAATTAYGVDQILGRALRYPAYGPEMNPDRPDDVCTGEHVPESLAQEAATRIAELRAKLARAEADRDAARIEAADARIEISELRQVANSRAETIGRLRAELCEARELANKNAIDRDAARAERNEARAELAQFVGPYSSWHILVSHRTDGSVGLTLAGAGPLIEKLARVADFRQERPDVGAWRIDRCETWTRRLPEPDPARALMDAMPGLTAEGAAEILADLARPGVETETSTETEEVTQS